MNFRFVLAFVALPLLVVSCATLNEDQCTATDWYTLGNTDGTSGKSSAYIGRHVEACNKFGIVPDQSAWRGGWEVGIRSYCTPSNGLNQGRDGRQNNNSCPVDLASAFNEGHRLGKSVYDAKVTRDALKREIDADIVAISEAKPEERATLQLKLELKRNRLFELQNELNRAERRADRFEFGGSDRF